MPSGNRHYPAAGRGASARAGSPIGELAAELKALVDQLETEIKEGDGPNWHFAGELRRLRQRAERLFDEGR